MKRDTREDFIAKALVAHDGKYSYDHVVYQGSKVKIAITCPEHGDFYMTPGAHINGKRKGCPKCAHETRFLSPDEFLARANHLHDDKFTYNLPENFSTRGHITIICPEHGAFTQRASSHLEGYGCKKCATRNQVVSLSREEYVEKAADIHGVRYVYTKLPAIIERMAYTKGTFICPDHGEFQQGYLKHLAGQGCKECAKEIPREVLTLEKIIERGNAVHNGIYTYLSFVRPDKDETNNRQYLVTYLCPEHGEVTQELYSHLKGIRCPRCTKAVSTQHNKVLAWLDSVGVEYTYNDRTLISPLEIDVYIPAYKLGIEVNGIYWHRHSQLQDRYYHYKKFKACEDAGIRLLQFWDVEVDKKWELMKSMVLNALSQTEEKIYARKCEVVELDSRTFQEFVDANHMEGSRSSGVRLGLMYGEKLVAAMGFSPNKTGHELTRFCSLAGVRVVGGFSKLLKHRPSGSITSYSFNRYSAGNVYRQNGFVMERENKFALFYLQDGMLKNRNNFMRYKLRKRLGLPDSDTRSERELAALEGAEQLFDAGTRTWVLPT